ncbi:YcxB family protein [Actinomadura mexicana]|uniref:YcxB-like protein n=1 Tax=Actinomadura mexicana TaxID=134959 RepID=A0A238WLS7_9ACTN|nr:YcxB family protein [Actinomadura mexicana]SNR47492.1 YcxB-like protein [Actinomadura mexicana]
MDITVRYEPTADDVAQAFTQGFRRQLTAVYAVLVAALTVGATVRFVAGNLTMGVTMLVTAALFPLAGTWWLRRRARKQLSFLCVPTTARVTDTGYDRRTDESTTTMHWAGFSNVLSSPGFWLLYVDGRPAVFLPKAAFDGARQAEIDDLLAARGSVGVGDG